MFTVLLENDSFKLDLNLSDHQEHDGIFKGCDSNFEVNIFQILTVATNETSTLKSIQNVITMTNNLTDTIVS